MFSTARSEYDNDSFSYLVDSSRAIATVLGHLTIVGDLTDHPRVEDSEKTTIGLCSTYLSYTTSCGAVEGMLMSVHSLQFHWISHEAGKFGF